MIHTAPSIRAGFDLLEPPKELTQADIDDVSARSASARTEAMVAEFWRASRHFGNGAPAQKGDTSS